MAPIARRSGPATGVRPPAADLSAREREIVRLVAAGLPNKAIGDVLGISPWTVSSYLRRLFAKCGVRSRAALVAAVMQSESAATAVQPRARGGSRR
jgi:DNA-binding CsgD family transcriptional regulator